MKHKNNQKGFATLEVVLIIIILILIGFTGWYIWNNHHHSTPDVQKSAAQNTGSLAQQHAMDANDESNISYLVNQLAVYDTDNNYYPTNTNFNDATWRAENMKNLDQTRTVASNGKNMGQPGGYQYMASPKNCDNVDTYCTDFTLTAKLSSGEAYTKTGF